MHFTFKQTNLYKPYKLLIDMKADNIYKKGLIEAHGKANGWPAVFITKVIQMCYKHNDFNGTVRTYRSKHTIHKALIYLQQRKMKHYYR